MANFRDKVIIAVKSVPYGTVVSYGQIATMIGAPRAARQVGWMLNSCEGVVDLPWWRVINNAGRISIKGTKYNDANLQRRLIESEGIPVTDLYELDIAKYRYWPTDKELERLQKTLQS